MEYWRTIPSFPVYSASNYGRIRNDNSGRILHVYLDSGRRYLTVALYRDGKQVTQRVHRLVAEAFLGGPHPNLDVNHIDGDKTNNCVENLEWCTRKENARHAVAAGLRKGPRRREVRIVETDELFDSVRSCARYFGVDVGSITWALNHSGIYMGCHIEYV